MFYFKKKISYFTYYESGEKKKSCGYARLLVKDNETTLTVQIQGLPEREEQSCDLYMAGMKPMPLGQLAIRQGTGCYQACFHTKDIDGQGLTLFQTKGLILWLNENCYCETKWEWEEPPEKITESEDESAKNEDVTAESGVGPTKSEDVTAESGAAPEEREGMAAESGAAPTKSEDVAAESGAAFEQMQPEEPAGIFHKSQLEELSSFSHESTEPLLYEDKWKQLKGLYPVCHPFGEEEDYISIAPRDFVILPGEYQILANNSFLLHSFYNYQHVILGQMNGADSYYIGVPGIYSEREKKVASMFGFEGFAQSSRNDTNVTNAARRGGNRTIAPGAFGYYMKRVEL